MLEVEVIDRPESATLALDPVKARLLQQLQLPGSAASLAAKLGLARQKVNYHLRALEEHGLVEPVEERQWGGLTERLVVATARSYVVSPGALGGLGVDPARNQDRLSASYLIAVAARIVTEVGALWRQARQLAGRPVPRRPALAEPPAAGSASRGPISSAQASSDPPPVGPQRAAARRSRSRISDRIGNSRRGASRIAGRRRNQGSRGIRSRGRPRAASCRIADRTRSLAERRSRNPCTPSTR